jgi:hypothetical protein
MMHRLFVILTDHDSPLWDGVYNSYRQQCSEQGTASIPVRPGETITFVLQASKRINKSRVERTIQEWSKSSPDGVVVVAYHNDWLDAWDGPRLLPFVPFSHEPYFPVYKHCLLPFSQGNISFHDAWRLLGQTGGLIETLKADLLAPFIPCHLFAQAQSSNPLDKEWQDIFAESRERLQQVEKANTLEKLLSFAPHDSDGAQQNLLQLFSDLSRRLISNSISKESALELRDRIEKFREGLDILLGKSYPEMKTDPIAAFRHSCDNALNYLSFPLCILTSGQTTEVLNNAIDNLIKFGEDFIPVRIQLLQGAKDVLDKQCFDEIKTVLANAACVYETLRDSLNAGPYDHGFSDNIRAKVQSLDDSFRQVLGLLRQEK